MPIIDVESLDPQDPGAVDAVVKHFKEKLGIDISREDAEKLLWKIKRGLLSGLDDLWNW